jgi:putative hydrolase of the HAD superfamily
VKTLLVDLDDTLLDYTSGIEGSWREACELIAGPRGVDPSALWAAVLEARRWFWDDATRGVEGRRDMVAAWAAIAARGLEQVGAVDLVMARAIAEDYSERRRACYCLLPGAADALAELRRRGVPMALITNGDRREQRHKIERFDLAKFFDVLIIEGEFGVGKPHESVYRHALAALDATAATTTMVGDNLEWDVAAPQRLGIAGVWVDAPGHGLPAGSPVKPDRIVRAFSELLALIPGSRS